MYFTLHQEVHVSSPSFKETFKVWHMDTYWRSLLEASLASRLITSLILSLAIHNMSISNNSNKRNHHRYSHVMHWCSTPYLSGFIECFFAMYFLDLHSSWKFNSFSGQAMGLCTSPGHSEETWQGELSTDGTKLLSKP